MKKFFSFFLLLLLWATPLSADNFVIDHPGAPEHKKYPPARGPEEADYEQRGVRNSLNGIASMWGKLIMNALPSDEPLPEKKKPGPPK